MQYYRNLLRMLIFGLVKHAIKAHPEGILRLDIIWNMELGSKRTKRRLKNGINGQHQWAIRKPLHD